MWTVWKITEIILDQSIKNIFPNQLNTSTFYRIKKKEKIMIKPIKMTPPRKRERKNFKTIYICDPILQKGVLSFFFIFIFIAFFKSFLSEDFKYLGRFKKNNSEK